MEIENLPSSPAEEIIDLFDYLLPVARVEFIIVLVQVMTLPLRSTILRMSGGLIK